MMEKPTALPCMLEMDWQATGERKGLLVNKLEPVEAESLQRACRAPGLSVGKLFGVCRNWRVSRGSKGGREQCWTMR
jgi:hypothetical protein